MAERQEGKARETEEEEEDVADHLTFRKNQNARLSGSANRQLNAATRLEIYPGFKCVQQGYYPFS